MNPVHSPDCFADRQKDQDTGIGSRDTGREGDSRRQIHRFMRYFYRGSFSAAKSGRERAPFSFLHLHKNNAFFLIIREQ